MFPMRMEFPDQYLLNVQTIIYIIWNGVLGLMQFLINKIHSGYIIRNCVDLQGIKRYNIFRYFEELNMLFPVSTEFDEENNTLFGETDELYDLTKNITDDNLSG